MAEKMKGGEESLPQKLSVVPLLGRPIFPGIFTPIMINNPADIKLIDEAMSGDAMIGLVLSENESDKPSAEELCRTGTSAKIVKKINLPDGGINIFISTLKRLRLCGRFTNQTPSSSRSNTSKTARRTPLW
jgi:ATP-dependent Lon protease